MTEEYLEKKKAEYTKQRKRQSQPPFPSESYEVLVLKQSKLRKNSKPWKQIQAQLDAYGEMMTNFK